MTIRAPWPLILPDSQAQRVACPFCEGTGHRCDQCEGDGWMFADELPGREEPTVYAEEVECASLQPLSSAGLGGSAPSVETSRQSTKTSRNKDTTPSASFATAIGSTARSFLPASGGKRRTSTPKQANSFPMKSAGPKSTAGGLTPGEHGHG